MKMTHTLCAALLLGALSAPAFAQTNGSKKPVSDSRPIETPMKPVDLACAANDQDCAAVKQGGDNAVKTQTPKAPAKPACSETEENCGDKTTSAVMPVPAKKAPTPPAEGTCITEGGHQVPCPDFGNDADIMAEPQE